MLIGVSFNASIELLFLEFIGTYVEAIHTQVQEHPYAVELDLHNFDMPPEFPHSLPHP
jgi:hypothetical protein